MVNESPSWSSDSSSWEEGSRADPKRGVKRTDRSSGSGAQGPRSSHYVHAWEGRNETASRVGEGESRPPNTRSQNKDAHLRRGIWNWKSGTKGVPVDICPWQGTLLYRWDKLCGFYSAIEILVKNSSRLNSWNLYIYIYIILHWIYAILFFSYGMKLIVRWFRELEK